MNIDLSYLLHKPIEKLSNIPINFFDNRKPIPEYFCPMCNKQLKYKQKQCDCGNWIWWKVKITKGMVTRVRD